MVKTTIIPLSGHDKHCILLNSMKIKQTVLALALTVTSLGGSLLLVPAAHAEYTSCGEGVKTAIIDCGSGVDNKSSDVSKNAIWHLLILTLNIMLAGVGVLAVAGVVWAGFLYVSAADSAEQVKKAKGIITNVVIGLVAFGLMYSGLNWLIPGGVFNG